MEIKKILKNGLFSATLLGCGWLQGGPNFCPNCGQCLKPPCPPQHCNTPPCPGDKESCINNEGYPCGKDAPNCQRSKRWNKHCPGDRGPSLKREGCFDKNDGNECCKAPKCCHCPKKRHKHFKVEHHGDPSLPPLQPIKRNSQIVRSISVKGIFS